MSELDKYYKLETEDLLNLMGQYLDSETLQILDKASIWHVASLHGIDYDLMHEYLNKPDRNSIYGGAKANEYYKLIRKHVEEQIQNAIVILEDKICTAFEYCKKRKNGELENENLSFVVALTDTIISYNINLPFPAGTTAIYLLKKGILDNLCKCKKTSP